MVDVAQLAEPQFVELVVAGSNPVVHPNDFTEQRPRKLSLRAGQNPLTCN